MSSRLPVVFSALLALAVALVSPSVFAQTQTTNSYDAGSTDADIRKSCKELSVSSGTLSGKCNKSGVSPQDTTWSLTGGKISCHNNTKEPFWTDNHDSSSDTKLLDPDQTRRPRASTPGILPAMPTTSRPIAAVGRCSFP